MIKVLLFIAGVLAVVLIAISGVFGPSAAYAVGSAPQGPTFFVTPGAPIEGTPVFATPMLTFTLAPTATIAPTQLSVDQVALLTAQPTLNAIATQHAQQNAAALATQAYNATLMSENMLSMTAGAETSTAIFNNAVATAAANIVATSQAQQSALYAPTATAASIMATFQSNYATEMAATSVPVQPTMQLVQPTVAPILPTVQMSTPVLNAVNLAATEEVGMPVAINTSSGNGWQVQYYDGITPQITAWGQQLKALVPNWSSFPNVDFPVQNFKASDGLEYGMAESAYCQQDETCDLNAPAMSYRLVTGDYSVGFDSCQSGKDVDGCALALFNVGTVTAMFRSVHIDYGFTVSGRYWNGDHMPLTIWALGSNTAYNMSHHDSVNAGANCSVPTGCKIVRFTAVILSGNQMLLKATTLVAGSS